MLCKYCNISSAVVKGSFVPSSNRGCTCSPASPSRQSWTYAIRASSSAKWSALTRSLFLILESQLSNVGLWPSISVGGSGIFVDFVFAIGIEIVGGKEQSAKGHYRHAGLIVEEL
jgi:hypothetical protein